MTQHHPSEMTPEPPEGYVVQSPYVKALMDAGSQALKLDKEYSAAHGEPTLFGEDFHDFARGGPVDRADVDGILAKIYAQDPEAWASAARSSLLMAQAAEDQQDLEQALTHHAAIVIAWLTAVQRRTPVGASN